MLATAAFALLSPLKARCETSEDLGFFIKSKVTFANEGNETWNLSQEDRSWPLFMNNSWQTVCLVGHAYPLEKTDKDVDGNLIAVFQSKSTILAGERGDDYVVYHVRSKPRTGPSIDYAGSGNLTQIPNDLMEEYCTGHGFWMTGEPQIREKALTIAGNETRVLVVVANLVSWIWNNIRYQSHDPTLYPNDTLSLREGDCDEQAILFGTFCRVLRIPAHLQVGCVFLDEASSSSDDGPLHFVLKQIAWHAWAMVYVPPWGWLPVDLTYVLASRADPLNAIRRGAVMLQYTVQSMNVSEDDYLASDRAYKDLLERGNFSLYVTDEMGEVNALLGDLSGDGVVNIIDAAIVAKAYRSRPNDTNWNRSADVNKDDTVNIIDISIVAREFGKTYQ
jgi:transglutaminase-like putative cysteine protease